MSGKCNKFIREICLALGLDIDGDAFTAINTETNEHVIVYVDARRNKIKIIENNITVGG